jgi:hypothetical protein
MSFDLTCKCGPNHDDCAADCQCECHVVRMHPGSRVCGACLAANPEHYAAVAAVCPHKRDEAAAELRERMRGAGIPEVSGAWPFDEEGDFLTEAVGAARWPAPFEWENLDDWPEGSDEPPF